jgi:hypothetical protein
MSALVASATATLVAVAWKCAGALLLWLAGRWLIGFGVRLLSRALANQQFDPRLSRYLQTGLSGCPAPVPGYAVTGLSVSRAAGTARS